MTKPNRPNVLYVFTDQQAASAMSCAGNPDIATPHMDRLAAEGVRFARAYCTYPLCTPARASMFTGRMPHEVGVTWNGQSIAEHLRVHGVGRLLEAADYDCGYAGKWHVPEGAMPEHNDHGFRVIHGFADEGLGGACAGFIRQERDRPFFLVASINNPHNICEWARSQRLPDGPIPEPASIDECPALPANFEPPAGEPEVLRWEHDINRRVYPTAAWSDDDWRRYRYAYFRLVEKTDAILGEILDALDAAGLTDETLIVFSSDHGDAHGSHRWNQKTCLYEEVVRIPLLVRPPGGVAGGSVDSEHLVSNGLDLLPTFCDYGRAEMHDGLRGFSLRPLLEGAAPAEWRDGLVIHTLFGDPQSFGTQGRAVVTNRHKYVVHNWGRDREQLFDLDADPGEMNDLSADPLHADVLDRLRLRLRDIGRETGDAFGTAWLPPGTMHVPGYLYD